MTIKRCLLQRSSILCWTLIVVALSELYIDGPTCIHHAQRPLAAKVSSKDYINELWFKSVPSMPHYSSYPSPIGNIIWAPNNP